VNSGLPNPNLETDELYQQMFEANFANWESVKSVQHITGPRAERLMAHILETKRMYWKIIAKACKLPTAPSGSTEGALEELMHYELEQIAAMDAATRATPLKYGSQRMTAASLIRLAARHSVWHAGQIALTRFD
jgi:uncharacterized damage-inducible protein DinB